jgi:putative ABC transport system permease protein
MKFDRARLHELRAAFIGHVGFSLRTAVEAVRHNKLRASLTSLGILFGVASVIAMLAIGRGAAQEILEQMKLLGSNNVMIAPLVEQKEGPTSDETPDRQVKKFSPGLTYADARALERVIPGIEVVAAEIVLNSTMSREGRSRSGKLLGVDSSYFRLTNLSLEQGTLFSPIQMQLGLPVAVIGHGVRSRFFVTENPIGQRIKVGNTWLTVIGVLSDRRIKSETAQRLGIRDVTMDVYVPVQTMLSRFRDRGRITQRDIELASRPGQFTRTEDANAESDETREERLNRNQLNRIIVRVSDSRKVSAVADVAQRMLERRHNAVVDFEITVPEMLLQQEQRTRTIFNLVLGAIASISLVVGGIGIMNIMLASVLERIREIGVRRAVGATSKDILYQFLAEAVLISVAGGTAGILLGIGFSYAIEHFADVRTIVSGASVIIAFGVSCAVGIIFGIVPAKRAAEQDTIISLRYE